MLHKFLFLSGGNGPVSRKTPKLSVGSIIISRKVVTNEFGNNLSGPCIHFFGEI